ncbi:ABC transporter permease subunit, partial [Streptomyces albireticuli]
MHELPQQLANGLILGAMYGLIAIGYTMVYGIVQLINFAHGEIFMVGGFGALTAHLALPDGTALALALPLMVLGGVLASVTIGVAAED